MHPFLIYRPCVKLLMFPQNINNSSQSSPDDSMSQKAKTAKNPTVVILCGSGIVYLIKVLSLSQKRENQEKEENQSDEEEMENPEKEENRKCHENFGSFDVSAFKELFSNYFSQSIKKGTSPLPSSFFFPLGAENT